MSYAHAPITRAGNLILRNKQSGIHKVYTGISLFGIQLDDEMLLDREVDVVSFRQGNYLAGKRSDVKFQPFRKTFTALFLERFEVLLRSGFLSYCNHISGFHQVGRNINLVPIYQDMTVHNELARLCTAVTDAKAEAHVIKTAFQ